MHDPYHYITAYACSIQGIRQLMTRVSQRRQAGHKILLVDRINQYWNIPVARLVFG